MFHNYVILVNQDSAPLLSSQSLPPFAHLRFHFTPAGSNSGRRLGRSFFPPKQAVSHIFPSIYLLLLLTSLLILQTVDCTTQSYRWIFPFRIVGLKSGHCTYFRSTKPFCDRLFFFCRSPSPNLSPVFAITSPIVVRWIFPAATAVSRYCSVCHTDVSLTDGTRCMTCPNYISGRNVRNWKWTNWLQLGLLLSLIIGLPRFSAHSEDMRICVKAGQVSIQMETFQSCWRQRNFSRWSP